MANRGGELLIFDNELYHHGVLGMRWGHHKIYDYGASAYKIHGDGRIEIPAGQPMQRLVTSNKLSKKNVNKTSAPLQKYAYMSFTRLDNAEYVNTMNLKSKKKADLQRDTILRLTTNSALKSPSVSEAQAINISVMKKYSDELNSFLDLPKEKRDYTKLSEKTKDWHYRIESEFLDYKEFHKTNKIMDKELETYYKHDTEKEYDPLRHPEKYPATMYEITNRSIGSNHEPLLTMDFLDAVKNKGYNMIRDENDTGHWAAPVIVLDPEKNVRVTASERISNKTIREADSYIELAKKNWKSLGFDATEISEYIKQQ